MLTYRANGVEYAFSPIGVYSSYFVGGDDGNDVMDPGETWTWQVTVSITSVFFWSEPTGLGIGFALIGVFVYLLAKADEISKRTKALKRLRVAGPWQILCLC